MADPAPTNVDDVPPHGFSARSSPVDLPGLWHDVVVVGDGRIGVVIGCDAEPGVAQRVRSAVRTALLETGDPLQSMNGVAGKVDSALCAVLDGATICYSSHGDSVIVIVAPGTPAMTPDHAVGRLAVSAMAPGATVLMCTRPVDAALLDGCASVHPEHLADRVIARPAAPLAAVLYRHPPAPLSITLPAEPASLAISRSRLRQWLAAAGVDQESCADVLLAVGEAAANATEHAVIDAPNEVRITVTAALTGNRLALTVFDDGRWKPAPAAPGYRGHGIPLINALVDAVELRTTPNGTTVAMLKELQP